MERTSLGRGILLVDDNETFTQVLARAFRKRGFSAYTASNEESTLEAVKKHQPSLVVLDLKLESTSGLSLISKILDINNTLEIIILTGYSSISTAVEAVKLGAVNYLCKPADADEILNAFNHRSGDDPVPVADMPPSLERVKWEHLQRVLSENNGNISATARVLGMHRRTLQRKLQKRPVTR